jgi:hypothetical protein
VDGSRAEQIAKVAVCQEGKFVGDQNDDDDFEQKLRDAHGDLLAGVASGQITEAEAIREAEQFKVLAEFHGIMAAMGPWPCSEEENLRREAELIRLWPEVCRRVGVRVEAMPDEVMRWLVGSVSRPN